LCCAHTPDKKAEEREGEGSLYRVVAVFVPRGEAFSNGTTAPGEDPSDRAGEIINCRCDTLPVLESAEALAWFPETQLPAPEYTV
ncbi:MAG: hypothetical protein ACO3NL_10530, partial [Phycisphaerales bacterium]